ncbi:Acetoin dehydrogenase operon transcriptional activator AcoR [Ephemeroptericola cinctiostellae]|uniref:Acetoin dehydrogenase operon transcriptional activator AcoR n=1 Tax=Ephemeroptericola cinctiostellae TaxID=2268024 RepID=A0A345DC14_9BURK|nr:helix-turn-helix domain-containing protein [Ephemeroptericola cinctiostellae]AXF85902.1 Acetoin dehydrogenase operon transcriptional activator AcoR [Ephemeroptericola cinctiostellae]
MRANTQLRDHRLKTEREWQQFVRDKSMSSESSWLQQSWGTSASNITLEQTCAPMDDPESVRRQFLATELYQVAKPLLDELVYAVTDSGFAVGFSDPSATLQWTAANRVMQKRVEKAHFLPSAHWDEASMGTNAVGLAARMVKPFAIFSAQHYVPSLHEWVCYAAPIVHGPSGHVAGVLDISAPWQNSTPMALATVSHYAQQISQLWSTIQLKPSFYLNLCGCSHGQWLGRTGLPRRLQEIFLTLALHPEGLSLEALHAHVYGDEPVSVSTLKSEISHLRQHLGDILQARPYRLALALQVLPTDAHLVEQYVLAGQFSDALNLYQRPVLPNSQAPAVVEYRNYLHQLVIRSLVASNNIDALWQFTVMHEAEYDVLLRLEQLLPDSDGRRSAVEAKLAQLE